jgi:RNA polymerase sigma-70 factor (ECF subfamily)
VAFEREVLPELGRLYRLALAIAGDRAAAEDVVQDTMVAAWRRFATLRDPQKLDAWLTRICVNQAVQQRRRLRRLVSLAWTLGPPKAGETPFELEASMLDVQRAFRKLSPAQRAVVVLHLYHGLTVDQCAGVIGCRPGTARSHLGRAVTKLRRELGGA